MTRTRLTTLLCAAALAATSLLPVAAAAEQKQSFNLAWTIYAGWMPWDYADKSGIMKKWADKYGIEVKITEARSYRGNRRSSFSYRDRGDAASHPAVWIVRAEDQPRGRQLLRDAGLLDSSRDGTSSYLSTAALHDGVDQGLVRTAGGAVARGVRRP